MTAEQHQLQLIVEMLNGVAVRLDGLVARMDDFEATADDVLARIGKLEDGPPRERAVRRIVHGGAS